jgi:hypothetical protein
LGAGGCHALGALGRALFNHLKAADADAATPPRLLPPPLAPPLPPSRFWKRGACRNSSPSRYLCILMLL